MLKPSPEGTRAMCFMLTVSPARKSVRSNTVWIASGAGFHQPVFML
jgi:hypothetical protein